MLSVQSATGVSNELLFEQRTPNTMRGVLHLQVAAQGGADTPREHHQPLPSPTNQSVSRRVAPAAASSVFPRYFLWRLRIAEGSTMLCSKLCGLMTVSHAGEVATEKISITLAVRVGSSASVSTSSDGQLLPSALRKETKLKIQWLELNPGLPPPLTASATQRNMIGVVTLDVTEAQAALQSSTKDRSRLEAMFRVGGHKVVTTDVSCTFSLAPTSSSQRSTAKFSAQNTLTDVPTSESHLNDGSTPQPSAASTPQRPSPVARELNPSAPANASNQHRVSPRAGENGTLDAADSATASTATVADRRSNQRMQFWLGFAVGAAFGTTFVISLLGLPALRAIADVFKFRLLRALFVSRQCVTSVKAHAAVAQEKAAVVGAALQTAAVDAKTKLHAVASEAGGHVSRAKDQAVETAKVIRVVASEKAAVAAERTAALASAVASKIAKKLEGKIEGDATNPTAVQDVNASPPVATPAAAEGAAPTQRPAPAHRTLARAPKQEVQR